MLINRNNYESILIDYLDGNLNDAQQREVEAFLLANSDIALEFEALQTATVAHEPISFKGKDELRKIPFLTATADDDFFTRKCIEKIENQLPASEEEAFSGMVNNSPANFRNYQLFCKTILPQHHLNYNEKILIKIDEKQPAIDKTNFAGYAIAYLEGWLNKEARKVVETYRKNHKEAEPEFQLIEQLKLLPDYAVTYPGKSLLKKQLSLTSRLQKQVIYWGSVAAVIAIGAFAFYLGDQEHNGIQQAINHPHEPKVVNETNIGPSEKKSVDLPITNTLPVTKQSMKSSVKHQQKHEVELVNVQYNNVIRDSNSINQLQSIQPVLAKQLDNENGQLNREIKPVLNNETAKQELLAQMEANSASQNTEVSEKVLARITRYGIRKIIEVSDGRIKIEQKADEKKTKVEVETRYFAFSTTTKQINF